MKHIFLIAFLVTSMITFGQGYLVTADKPFVIDRVKDSGMQGSLSRDRASGKLSSLELDYLYWVNHMRAQPWKFYSDYIEPFLLQFPEARTDESVSLKAELRMISSLPLLSINILLNGTSKEHANYLTERTTLSHTGKGGKGFRERMKDAGLNTCAGEVIYSGKDDALIALILLLIDHRVPDLGHRRALLNPEFLSTGVGISYMKDGAAVYVQDFACK